MRTAVLVLGPIYQDFIADAQISKLNIRLVCVCNTVLCMQHFEDY
jgi:hypothetical protein